MPTQILTIPDDWRQPGSDVEAQISQTIISQNQYKYESPMDIEVRGFRVCRDIKGKTVPVGKFHKHYDHLQHQEKYKKIEVRYRLHSSPLSKGWQLKAFGRKR